MEDEGQVPEVGNSGNKMSSARGVLEAEPEK